jgi:hypothetical protein
MRRTPLLALLLTSLTSLTSAVACGGSSGTTILGDGSGSSGGSGGSAGAVETSLANGGAIADNGGTVHFTVKDELLLRYPTAGFEGCNSNPYTPSDSYQLIAYGPADLAPRPEIEFNVPANVVLGTTNAVQPIPWKLAPVPRPQDNYTNQEVASNQKASLGVSLGRGADPEAPDHNAFDQASVTVLTVPTAPGELLTVRLQLHFVDGQTLDQTFRSPPARPVDAACAVGGAPDAHPGGG